MASEGKIVSSNIAPSTATISVLQNKTFGWAYGGMPFFKPYEVFLKETTNVVMTAMLLSDVFSGEKAVKKVRRNIYIQIQPPDTSIYSSTLINSNRFFVSRRV
tara:strand:- start:487 stop:795 length:309 start_codon:yes stop_codon:yes gene_type:complete